MAAGTENSLADLLAADSADHLVRWMAGRWEVQLVWSSAELRAGKMAASWVAPTAVRLDALLAVLTEQNSAARWATQTVLY